MPGLRLEIACGPRQEVHFVPDAEVSLGRASDNDVVIDHPSVDTAHARIALRRDRILVIPHTHGQRSVRVGRRVVGAPVAVEPGTVVGLGDVTIVPAPAVERPPPTIAGFLRGLERPAPDHLRRFDLRRADDSDEGIELAWADLPAPEVAGWIERASESAATAHVAPLLAHGEHDGGWLIERVGRGVRLAVVLDAIARGKLTVPPETAIVITSGLATALASFHRTWGPHGAFDGRLVALGADGAVRLLRPGPQLEGWSDRARRRYLAPERRTGGLATKVADAWSLARLARDLGAPPGPWARLSEPDPARRPTDVLDAGEQARLHATRAGLDPSTRHVAQLVDLVSPPARALAHVSTTVFGRDRSGAAR